MCVCSAGGLQVCIFEDLSHSEHVIDPIFLRALSVSPPSPTVNQMAGLFGNSIKASGFYDYDYGYDDD